MGYYDTIRNAKIGEDAKLKKEAAIKGMNIAEATLANQQKEYQQQQQNLDLMSNALQKSFLMGAQAGVADTINQKMQMQQPQAYQEPSLGINQGVAEQMGDEALMQKANSIVDQLDAAQAQGAPKAELTKIYNTLEPRLKQAVTAIKVNKLKQQQRRQPQQGQPVQTPGSAVERINSPITKAANQILNETIGI